jgi:hypothetical protein
LAGGWTLERKIYFRRISFHFLVLWNLIPVSRKRMIRISLRSRVGNRPGGLHEPSAWHVLGMTWHDMFSKNGRLRL